MAWTRLALFLLLAVLSGTEISLANSFPISGSFSEDQGGLYFEVMLALSGPSFSVSHLDVHDDWAGFEPPDPGWSGRWTFYVPVDTIDDFGFPESPNGRLNGVSGTVGGVLYVQTASFSTPPQLPYQIDNLPVTLSGSLSAYNFSVYNDGMPELLWSVKLTGSGYVNLDSVTSMNVGDASNAATVSGSFSGTATTTAPEPSSLTLLLLVVAAAGACLFSCRRSTLLPLG